MSLRVRKLARELGRDPAYVLGVLHHLGFERFRSIQDMLPDRIVGQVRAAVAEGLEIRSAPVTPRPSRVAQQVESEPDTSADLMASLVPGVVPLSKTAQPKQQPISVLEEEVVIPVEPVAPEPEDEVRLVGRWEELLERERALQRAEESLAFSLAAHETAVREAGELQVVDVPKPVQPVEAVDEQGESQRLIDLLAIRGVVEAAEQSAALKAFAEHPALLRHLLQVQVSTSSKLAELIDSQVVLTDGSPPECLHGYAGVEVAKERAEWPGEEQLGRSVNQLSSGFLLRGFRRVVFVELGEREALMLRHRLDARIEWTMTGVGSETGGDLSLDAGGAPDAVVVWGPCEAEDLAARCAARGIWCVQLEPKEVLARIDALSKALDGD